MYERELGQEETTLAAERGRSPSDAASVVGPAAGPHLDLASAPPSLPPAAQADPAASPTAVDGDGPSLAQASASEAATVGDFPQSEAEGFPDGDGAEDDAFADEGALPKEPFEEPIRKPRLAGTGASKARRLVKPEPPALPTMTPEQRLLILDTWQRSGLPGGDFAALVGLSKHTLYAWKKKFQAQGPAGLMDHTRGGPKGSRLPELTKRSILMLKQSNPAWGCQRISDMLLRGPALPASPAAVAKVLHEAGYELQETPTHPHPDKPRLFERATANQLWQTDLFTFMLKRQNRRVYLVAFMDDHSRFLTGYGLYASQSAALVLEVVRAAIGVYGPPQEILTDNGTQYVTWRGKGVFTREMEKRGIRQIVASPHRPQTLGKIERFWGTLWRECVEAAVFLDIEDARRRIGHFIDYYNFQRPHQGIGGLVPADRFFGAAPDVLQTLRQRVAANALELARNGVPKAPFYVTGRIGDRAFSVHAEGERMILKREGQERTEVDLATPGMKEVPLLGGDERQAVPQVPLPVCPDGSPQGEMIESPDEEGPGASPLDAALHRLDESLREGPPALSSRQGGAL